MKRILSLTLVAIMLFSTLALTSCDAVKDVLGNVLTGEARTTITEEEWQKTLLLDNYTMTIKSDYENEEIMRVGSLVKINQSYSKYVISGIVDFENNLLYFDSSLGYYSVQTEIDSFSEQYNLDNWLEDIKYEDLVYEELTKSYNVKINNRIMDLHFANGVLSNALIMSTNQLGGTVEIKNIGKTVVERPETFAKLNDGKAEPSTVGKIARTQITENEWEAVEIMNNCTLQIISVQDDLPIEVIMKVTDKAVSESSSFFGVVSEENLKVAVDGYYHTLEKDSEGKYIAQKTDEEVTSILDTVIDVDTVSFADLVYNEEGRFYSLTLNDNVLCFYFENGKLIKIDIFFGSATNEMVAVISDIGTTSIEIPEYTVSENTEG